jgi:CCR4-NOT transcriptional regulation complex NOT5 subunit
MSIEAINVVVAAEMSTEKLRSDALMEARKILADAEAVGKNKVLMAKDMMLEEQRQRELIENEEAYIASSKHKSAENI